MVSDAVEVGELVLLALLPDERRAIHEEPGALWAREAAAFLPLRLGPLEIAALLDELPHSRFEILKAIHDLVGYELARPLSRKEIEAMVDRWRVARLLHEGRTYREIEESTGLSSRTIARISRWLRSGEGGYQRQLVHHHRT